MNEMAITVVSNLAFLMPLFFWARGIVRGNKGDMAAGLILLFLISFGALVVSGDFPIAGSFLLFGITTLIAGSFAKPDCALKRRDRIAIAILFITLGILGSTLI
jgi:hypothetical protein